MALASKKSEAVHNKTGSEKAALKSSFDNAKHTELETYPPEAAMLYQMQQMQEDIEELRRYITAEVGDGATGARGATGSTGSRGATGSDGATPAMTDLSGSTLPTTYRGLARGKLWNDRGVVKIA